MNIMDENLKRKKNLRIGFVEDRRKKKKSWAASTAFIWT